jgi:hypothetical protein
MRKRILLMLLYASLAAGVSALPRTMRVDYYHAGNVSQESFSLDRVVLEPLEWPGNPNPPIDHTNLGK